MFGAASRVKGTVLIMTMQRSAVFFLRGALALSKT
jgi:hypothetical protein